VRIFGVAFLAVLAIAGAVLHASETQRTVAEENFREAQVAKEMAAQLLRGNNALDRFLAGGREQMLLPYIEEQRALDAALADATELSSDNQQELHELTLQAAASRRWTRLAQGAMAARRRSAPITNGQARETALTDFLAANNRFQRILDGVRRDELAAAALSPVRAIVVLSLLFGLVALLLVVRRRRADAERRRDEDARLTAEAAYSSSQSRFVEAMQVAEDQQESHELLTGHLQKWLPDAGVKVLIRNNSGDRLEAATPLSDDDPVAVALEQATPRACLGVRLSRPVTQGGNSDEVLSCGICGSLGGQSVCQPLLVGGEVIGSVLTTQERDLREHEQRRIHDSVAQAAPVLANLR